LATYISLELLLELSTGNTGTKSKAPKKHYYFLNKNHSSLKIRIWHKLLIFWCVTEMITWYTTIITVDQCSEVTPMSRVEPAKCDPLVWEIPETPGGLFLTSRDLKLKVLLPWP